MISDDFITDVRDSLKSPMCHSDIVEKDRAPTYCFSPHIAGYCVCGSTVSPTDKAKDDYVDYDIYSGWAKI